jgi:hypothetical protein
MENIMRKFATGLVALSLFAAPAAFAQNAGDFATADANGDGIVTLEEMQAIWPEFTADQLTAADTDLSGGLSDTEFDEAVATSGMSTTVTDQPVSETQDANDSSAEDAGKDANPPDEGVDNPDADGADDNGGNTQG